MKGANVLEYFTTHQWSFETDNVTSFYEKLNAEDRKVNSVHLVVNFLWTYFLLLQNFNFDIKQVNWEEYLVHYCKGIKQYAMKEDFKNISQKRKLQRRYSYLCWLVWWFNLSLGAGWNGSRPLITWRCVPSSWDSFGPLWDGRKQALFRRTYWPLSVRCYLCFPSQRGEWIVCPVVKVTCGHVLCAWTF